MLISNLNCPQDLTKKIAPMTSSRKRYYGNGILILVIYLCKDAKQFQLASNVQKAREISKKIKLDKEAWAACHELPEDDEATVTTTHSSDEDFDPNKELNENILLKLETFLEEWVISLDCDDKISLTLFLDFYLRQLFNFTATGSREHASIMLECCKEIFEPGFKNIMPTMVKFRKASKVVMSHQVYCGPVKISIGKLLLM